MALIGEVRTWLGKYEPAGWMFCDGRYLAIVEFPELFSVVGWDYSSVGAMKKGLAFALPDLNNGGAIGAIKNSGGLSDGAIKGGVINYIVCYQGEFPKEIKSRTFTGFQNGEPVFDISDFQKGIIDYRKGTSQSPSIKVLEDGFVDSHDIVYQKRKTYTGPPTSFTSNTTAITGPGIITFVYTGPPEAELDWGVVNQMTNQPIDVAEPKNHNTKIFFPEPGTYDIYLTATNDYGSNSILSGGYITVLPG